MKTKRSVTLTTDLIEAINKICKEDEREFSTMVRILLSKGLKQHNRYKVIENVSGNPNR